MTFQYRKYSSGAPRRKGCGQGDPGKIAALVSDWAAAKLESEPSTAELHNELLKLVEPPLLEEALKHSHGQYVTAARRLGLHRTTVKKKLNQYGMDSDEGPE